jgi:hypothetical protein
MTKVIVATKFALANSVITGLVPVIPLMDAVPS